MVINRFICEYCGKEFFSKYYRGGYIDHYGNFSSHKNSFGNDIDDDISEICLHGNDVRDVDDIQERLNCYLKWDNISDEMKSEVTAMCNALIDKVQKAQRKAKDIVKNMTMLERRYLIEEAKDNCHTPSGNEDGKMWD